LTDRLGKKFGYVILATFQAIAPKAQLGWPNSMSWAQRIRTRPRAV